MYKARITLDHVPREDHEGIGRVANAWAYLEGVVERLIWCLARIDDNRGGAITTHMAIRNRMDAACALADLEFPNHPQTAKLKSLGNQVTGALYGARNEVVHSRTLYIEWAGSVRPTYKSRGVLKKEVKLVEPGSYRETEGDILDSANSLREILEDFIALLTEKYGVPPGSAPASDTLARRQLQAVVERLARPPSEAGR
jgi:hypothetical protein